MSRLWKRAKAFGLFWYGFVIGDDWLIAAGVAAAVAATWGLRTSSVAAWWLLPVCCVAIVAVAIRRANDREG